MVPFVLHRTLLPIQYWARRDVVELQDFVLSGSFGSKSNSCVAWDRKCIHFDHIVKFLDHTTLATRLCARSKTSRQFYGQLVENAHRLKWKTSKVNWYKARTFYISNHNIKHLKVLFNEWHQALLIHIEHPTHSQNTPLGPYGEGVVDQFFNEGIYHDGTPLQLHWASRYFFHPLVRPHLSPVRTKALAFLTIRCRFARWFWCPNRPGFSLLYGVSARMHWTMDPCTTDPNGGFYLIVAWQGKHKAFCLPIHASSEREFLVEWIACRIFSRFTVAWSSSRLPCLTFWRMVMWRRRTKNWLKRELVYLLLRICAEGIETRAKLHQMCRIYKFLRILHTRYCKQSNQQNWLNKRWALTWHWELKNERLPRWSPTNIMKIKMTRIAGTGKWDPKIRFAFCSSLFWSQVLFEGTGCFVLFCLFCSLCYSSLLSHLEETRWEDDLCPTGIGAWIVLGFNMTAGTDSLKSHNLTTRRCMLAPPGNHKVISVTLRPQRF